MAVSATNATVAIIKRWGCMAVFSGKVCEVLRTPPLVMRGFGNCGLEAGTFRLEACKSRRTAPAHVLPSKSRHTKGGPLRSVSPQCMLPGRPGNKSFLFSSLECVCVDWIELGNSKRRNLKPAGISHCAMVRNSKARDVFRLRQPCKARGARQIVIASFLFYFHRSVVRCGVASCN